MRNRLGVVAVGLVAAALLPPVACGSEVPTRLPLVDADIPVRQENWYSVSMLSTRIAWTRYAIERISGDGGSDPALVRVTQENHVRAKIDGATTTSVDSKILDFDALPPYALVGCRVSSESDDSRESLVVSRSATGMSAVRTGASGTREEALGTLDFTLEDLLALRTWCASGRSVGDTLTSRAFDTLNLVVGTRRLTVLDVGVLDPAIDTTRWVDVRTEDASDGSTSTVRFDVAGRRSVYMEEGALSARLTTESGAKRETPCRDVLDGLARVKVDAPIGGARTLSGLTLEADGSGADRIPNGPGQSIVRAQSSGKVVITLGDADEPPPAGAEEIADALAPIARYGAGLPELDRLVPKAVGDAKSTREKVRALVEFVATYVDYDIHLGDKPIAEILRTRRGDCSEKAILFTALSRAAGIPAREVEGLSYLGDRSQAFAGHGWNEVVVDGRWLSVDATAGDFPADVARIALGRGVPADVCIPRVDIGAVHVVSRRLAR